MTSLDDRDLKILTILQIEGRLTKAALAERVNLSPAACWERLQRLERGRNHHRILGPDQSKTVDRRSRSFDVC